MPLQLNKPKPAASAVKSGADKYQKLLEKIQGMKLGGGGFWKPVVGRNIIRILPATGQMQYFFKEVGTHYLANDKYFKCLSITTDGQQECPLCQVHQALQDGGDKKAAETFYPSRAFNMNIIDRNNPDAGVQVFSPGVKIFQDLAAFIQDPEYGDITDVAQGFDVKIDRTGEGNKTQYQVTLARNPSVLGTQEQVDEWLAAAQDLDEQALKLPTAEELIRSAGLESYFGMTPAAEEPEQADEVEPWDEDEDEAPQQPAPRAAVRPVAPTASGALKQRMEQRAQMMRKAK